MSRNQISETDVILNFMEDACASFIRNPDINFEFPAGSWSGSKNRNIADIHGANIAAIEAKPSFAAAKSDYLNPNKNVGIEHYIYSCKDVDGGQISFWKRNHISACVYLTSASKWAILNDETKLFTNIIPPDKQYK